MNASSMLGVMGGGLGSAMTVNAYEDRTRLERRKKCDEVEFDNSNGQSMLWGLCLLEYGFAKEFEITYNQTMLLNFSPVR